MLPIKTHDFKIFMFYKCCFCAYFSMFFQFLEHISISKLLIPPQVFVLVGMGALLKGKKQKLALYCGHISMVKKQGFYVYHGKTLYIKLKFRPFPLDIKSELSTLSTGFSTGKTRINSHFFGIKPKKTPQPNKRLWRNFGLQNIA